MQANLKKARPEHYIMNYLLNLASLSHTGEYWPSVVFVGTAQLIPYCPNLRPIFPSIALVFGEQEVISAQILIQQCSDTIGIRLFCKLKGGACFGHGTF